MSTIPAADDSEHLSQVARPTESRGNLDDIGSRLDTWLCDRLPDAAPEITHVEIPDSNGMSSETVLFDATWSREQRRLVARVAPSDAAVPVFPTYDFDSQFRVMQLVREHTTVPVPAVHWFEPDPTPLGAPLFVMERADGLVPPDVMPYNFDSWITRATEDERRELQRSTIAVLGELHGIDGPAETFDFLRLPGFGETVTQSLSAHLRHEREYYEWTTRTGPRSPLIERAFDWLDQHLPEDDTPAVFCWGDSRIGNVMYQNFRPSAVLDWEMATLGPRELDLGWIVYLHRFFEDLAQLAGLDGLPNMLRLGDVAEEYEAATGHTPRDLEYYVTYAALRQATIMLRIQTRAIHFGQASMPEDADDLIMHRTSLEAMLDGSYWERLP